MFLPTHQVSILNPPYSPSCYHYACEHKKLWRSRTNSLFDKLFIDMEPSSSQNEKPVWLGNHSPAVSPFMFTNSISPSKISPLREVVKSSHTQRIQFIVLAYRIFPQYCIITSRQIWGTNPILDFSLHPLFQTYPSPFVTCMWHFKQIYKLYKQLGVGNMWGCTRFFFFVGGELWLIACNRVDVSSCQSQWHASYLQ